MWWKRHLFGGLVIEGFIGLHRTIQLQLLWHQWLGHKLGLLWCWMVWLGELRPLCHFCSTPVLHFRLFCWLWALSHFFYGILAHSSRYNEKWKSLSHVQLFATPWKSSWNSPGQNTGVDSHFLLQGIFLTRPSNPGLPHWSRFFTSWATREAQDYWSG